MTPTNEGVHIHVIFSRLLSMRFASPSTVLLGWWCERDVEKRRGEVKERRKKIKGERRGGREGERGRGV